ncbi:hypothetical protein CJ030_MR1G018422 [Morella rubra]|uniref:RNase H type-1 domain-containing protein n=1 Tax=Morella rubra TaxID=262757 RepID=A0A6A1WMU5_9ROSI|nr:hypothetical protein CJ030_MR1G018422 [Morella rubra]
MGVDPNNSKHVSAWTSVSKDSSLGWKPPAVGSVKCNVDVAMSYTHSVLVVVFRDHEGSLYTVYTESIPSQDSLLGEIAAFFAATRLAIDLPFSRILFESDCLVLVQDIFDLAVRIGWQAEGWVSSIRSFFRTHPQHSLGWVSCRSNKLVHRLAKWAATKDVFGFINLTSILAFIVDSNSGCG